MTAAEPRPRSSRRRSPPGSQPLPPVSPHARRRVIGWLSFWCLGLLALPVVVTVALHLRTNHARSRVLAMAAGTPDEREHQESALLDDWDTVSDAVRATFEDAEADPMLRRRCGEMLRIKSSNEVLSIREKRSREIRLGFNFGSLFTQEIAQDHFIENWPTYEAAAHDLSRDRDLPDCVRLRCIEMIQVTSDKPAAVAMANYSRAMRCYKAAGRTRDPAAATDAEAAFVQDDVSQYQTPDDRFELGAESPIFYERARDLFSLGREQYYDIADQASGNEKVSAEDRGKRCNRLYLACVKFCPLDFYTRYKQEREAAYLKHKAEQDAEQHHDVKSEADNQATPKAP